MQPYGERLGATKASPAGENPFQKMGSIWISFSFLAGKGSSEMRAEGRRRQFLRKSREAMLTANEDAAISAFGAALQSQRRPDDPGVRPNPVRPAKAGRDAAAPQTVAA